ncbi:PVC-type heme-binding CxxCH protein [Planctomicrobium sp. SH661]|uniref:PVC-type heme-binding CxxCH protein n=1 Tax=Planctomicrobium sp. SH661 TaxID=3448124 RepID=UPI003F5B2C31
MIKSRLVFPIDVTLYSRAIVFSAAVAVSQVTSFLSPIKAAELVHDVCVPSSEAFYSQAVRDSAGQVWKPLFNGQNLDGWKVVLQNAAPGEDPESIFQAVDGVIHVYKDTPAGKKMPFGVLLSDGSYSHYRFRFDFKWGEKKFAPRADQIRDAGLLFHVIGPEAIWPMSVECQVQEGDVGDNYLVFTAGDVPIDLSNQETTFAPQVSTLTRFYRPRRGSRIIKNKTLEHDGWNTVEVIVRGTSAVYLVNGEVCNYVVNMSAPIGPNEEFKPLDAGRLALQCEGAELCYRNIELMPLPEAVTDSELSSSSAADESTAPVPALSPEMSRNAWSVRPGYRIEVAANEPLVRDPVAIDWGLDGKLWVAEMADYPLGLDGHGRRGGRICFLRDLDGDGHYDASTPFLDGVNFPTGIVAWGNGVIVTAAPEIFYAEDVDGDGRCDVRKVLFSGFQEGNQQLRMNGLRWGLDGWLHCASGSHDANYGKVSRIRSHMTGEELVIGSRDFRFRPATGEIEPLPGPSQFGRNSDDVGNWFGVQNSFPLWHYVLEDRYLRRNPHVPTPEARQLLSKANPRLYPVAVNGSGPTSQAHVGRFTSACSGMIYRDNLLPLGEGVTHAFTCDPVHHLVQHNLLTRSGSTFLMNRDATGDELDFLASADPWCRPVMVRTGPDGALWIVDMYRYIIEHPEWVTGDAKEEMMQHLRLGDGRGRIFRLLPSEGPARSVPDILHASPAELVELLTGTNSWVRDSAHRRLVDLHEKSTIPALQKLLLDSKSVPTTLHAAYVLNSLEVLDSEDVITMLRNPSEDVRRHGLILAETIDSPSPELLQRISELASDQNAIVRLQVACSLGEWNNPVIHDALARLWTTTELDDSFLQGALLSSLNRENIATVMAAADGMSLKSPADQARYSLLIRQSLAFGHLEPVKAALRPDRQTPEEVARAILLMDIIEREPAASAARSLLDSATVSRLCQSATLLLSQADQPEAIRAACTLSLFRRSQTIEEDRTLTRQLLSQNPSAILAQALFRHLGSQPDSGYAELLLSGWSGYAPSVRSLALETWASQPGWYLRFLKAIDQKEIAPGEVSLALQQQFLLNSTANIANELEQRFQLNGSSTESLQEIVNNIKQHNGEATRGKIIFQKHCADCHQFREEGQAVGPNLSSLTGRTLETLVDAILSPNKAVEPRYLNYTVALNDGRILSGIIEADTESSLTLLKAKAERTPVLRTEIDELRSTNKSLMPEGFIKTINPQELADLIQFLQLNE